MSSRIVVVGSVNADLVVEVERRPDAGETLSGGPLRTLPGGKGANAAAAAARAGGDVAFVGCVGDDAHGRFLADSLAKAGVDVGLLKRGAEPTGTAIITVTPDGENAIVVSPGANGEVSAEQVCSALGTAGILAAGDAHAGASGGPNVVVVNLEIPLAAATAAAQAGDQAGARMLFNAAPARLLDATILRCCDPLVVNEHEAEGVLGVPPGQSFEELAERLCDAGAKSVVITLGAEGALVRDRSGVSRVPAYEVDVVDTTGAGDAFVGALATEIAGGRSLREAAAFATGMSALSVQRPGAQGSYSERVEVEAFISARSR